MRPESRWFESLAPAPGGVERLRRSMRAEPEAMADRWRPAFAACALALVLGFVIAPGGTDLAPAVVEVARGRGPIAGQWVEVPGARRDVRLYLAMESRTSAATTSER